MTKIMSSSDHASAAQRMLVKGVCRKMQECIEMMPATSDPERLERLTNAVLRLVTTINKMPAFRDGEDEKGRSVDSLVDDMTEGDAK